MRGIIFINGVIEDLAPIAVLLRESDLLVAADGGARYILALNRIPHLLVGDLDSIDPHDLARLEDAGVEIRRSSTHKNETDLELAIDAAIESGSTEVLLVGATGGRLDQTIANVLILAQREWGVPLRVVDGDQIATLLRGPAKQEIVGQPGALVSAIPLSTPVTGITYAGLEYPLVNHTLLLGSTRGVSNVLASEHAVVQVEAGLLLLIVGKGARFGD
jgi:thiamine pyrophosphokinase